VALAALLRRPGRDRTLQLDRRFALAVFVLCYLLARGCGWLRAAAAGGYAYLLISPWIPPSTIAVIAFNSQFVAGRFTFTPRHGLYAAIFAVALAGLVWVLGRARAPLEIRFAVLLAACFTGVMLPWFWWHIAVVPQPWRYQLEFEPCHLPAGRGRGRAAVTLPAPAPAPGGGFRAGAGLRAVHSALARRDAPGGESHRHPPHHRVAYRPLGRREPERGARVCVRYHRLLVQRIHRCSPACWRFDQGDIQRAMPTVHHQIVAGADGAVARDWLRIYGCDAVIVSGPASEEQLKPYAYAYPRKFEGVLPVLWRESDVTIYAVPRRSRALAQVVRPPTWRRVSLRTPAGQRSYSPFWRRSTILACPQPLSSGWGQATRALQPIFNPAI